jgi:hypothetical protein
MKPIKCENFKKCGNYLTEGVARYSRAAFGGQELCISCQKIERLKTRPKRLAEYFNSRI